MNNAAPDPIIPEAELGIAEARLATFDRDGLGHTLDAVRQWAANRAKDPTALCPPPTTLR
jgi:hypothetical protein